MTMPHSLGVLTLSLACAVPLVLSACACSPPESPESPESPASEQPEVRSEQAPPANIQAWMDRLTVAHAYDPETGFIVAREVVTLPTVLRDGPSLEQAVREGERTGRPVVVFATADRCAPCQQFKLDALNNPAVIRRLGAPDLIATHVEVDREHESAVRILGSAGIPVSYLIVDGEVVDRLPGQRSAKEVLAWLDRERAKS